MFTWICPTCGREVPPSYTECPDCAARAKAPAATETAAAPEAKPAPQAPPLPVPQPVPESAARKGPPTWLMTILFALVFGAVAAGAYFVIQYSKEEPAAPTKQDAAALESPPAAPSTPVAKVDPLLKQIEIVGLRLTQNAAKKTEVRFLVVNHSGAEIQDFAAKVNLQARTSKKDEEPVGSFSFKLPLLGPYESKEITAVVDTKLKVYELPDWQNLDMQLQIAPR